MKLWEINEKKCIENIKMPNIVHKSIYVSLKRFLIRIINKLIKNMFFEELESEWKVQPFVLYRQLYRRACHGPHKSRHFVYAGLARKSRVDQSSMHKLAGQQTRRRDRGRLHFGHHQTVDSQFQRSKSNKNNKSQNSFNQDTLLINNCL